MIAVLVSTFVAFVTRAATCAGLPACNWYVYAAFGGGIGAVTLPMLVLWVLGRPKAPDAGNTF